ncbi:MAG: hypothetical protein ACI845_001508 [Gammaproteobacteria bacterium]|jgi:hypothetical protein
MSTTAQKNCRLKPEDLIDLKRYPIHRLQSQQGQKLLEECHRMMAEDTICILPGFLQPEVTSQLAEEITRLESKGRNINFMSTAYSWMDNRGFPRDHPRSQLFKRHCSALTTEQIESDGLCVQLFQIDLLTEFVRQLLGYDRLYPSACPTISVRLNIMKTNDEFGWHYDTNDGVVSFITQNAENGGIFEYAPLIRSEDDENYPAVERIVDGIDVPVRADTPPGTFTLFMGRRSLHRVSPVFDSTKSRQSLLFSYDRNPGMVFPEHIRKRLTEPSSAPFYGASNQGEPE